MMIWFIILLFVLFIAAAVIGYFRIVQLAHLNGRRVFISLRILLILLTVMTAASWLGIFSPSFAIMLIMTFYMLAAGIFLSYSIQFNRLRSKEGDIEYRYRSPWIDFSTNLIDAALFGLSV